MGGGHFITHLSNCLNQSYQISLKNGESQHKVIVLWYNKSNTLICKWLQLSFSNLNRKNNSSQQRSTNLIIAHLVEIYLKGSFGGRVGWLSRRGVPVRISVPWSIALPLSWMPPRLSLIAIAVSIVSVVSPLISISIPVIPVSTPVHSTKVSIIYLLPNGWIDKVDKVLIENISSVIFV